MTRMALARKRRASALAERDREPPEVEVAEPEETDREAEALPASVNPLLKPMSLRELASTGAICFAFLLVVWSVWSWIFAETYAGVTSLFRSEPPVVAVLAPSAPDEALSGKEAPVVSILADDRPRNRAAAAAPRQEPVVPARAGLGREAPPLRPVPPLQALSEAGLRVAPGVPSAPVIAVAPDASDPRIAAYARIAVPGDVDDAAIVPTRLETLAPSGSDEPRSGEEEPILADAPRTGDPSPVARPETDPGPVTGVETLSLSIFAPSALGRRAIEETLDSVRASGLPVSDAKRVSYRISTTQVRYFHQADRAAAQRIADSAGAELRDFTDFRPEPPSGTMELWLAGQPSRTDRSPVRTQRSLAERLERVATTFNNWVNSTLR